MSSTSPAPSATMVGTASVEQAQQWSSTLVSYSVRLEHVAVDISTDRILYHLECELTHPLPPSFLVHGEFVCLGWPLGGLWKVVKLGDGHRFLHCVAWRKTELNHEHINEMNDELLARQQVRVPDPPLTIFPWKMQLGTWKDHRHWFLRDALPPPAQPGAAVPSPALDTPVHIQLLAGLAPIEVFLAVNSLTSIDTVAQTFTADVTWTVTLPGVTAIREDSVLRELLDLLDFNEDKFDFLNLTSAQDVREIATVLAPAGVVTFQDPLSPQTASVAHLSHLKYSRRVVAVFSEEMSLYNFPYDQQKLTLAFALTGGVRASMAVIPAPIAPGTFALDAFKLGNVFRVVYGDKVFVGTVVDSGGKKTIEFEVVLARHSMYYFTNVALPSAIITYLCFSTFAPLEDGSMIDTSSRLQIVITLLLTAVTFKSQVASLLPQVSYFTSLDKYVFFCFVVTCLVTLENSLFPSLVQLFPTWKEDGLLVFSVGAFTLVNVLWLTSVVLWIRRRTHRAHVLLQVEEYVRIVSATVPASHREAVLREYLAELNLKAWELPTILSTPTGVLYIELPEESTSDPESDRHNEVVGKQFRTNAHESVPSLQRIYHKLDPSAPAMDAARSSIDPHGHHNGRGTAGMASASVVVNLEDEADVVPFRLHATPYRRQSQA